MQPLLRIAAEEAEELIGALGGPDEISPQRRILVEDLTATGIVLRSELARFLQTGDGDAAARVGSLAGCRRASLAVLGLERVEREIDLSAYLAGREVETEDSRLPESDSSVRKEPE